VHPARPLQQTLAQISDTPGVYMMLDEAGDVLYIGKAVSLALLREGYAVVLAGRREEPLQRAVAEANAGAGKALAVPTDVGNPDSVRKLFTRAKDSFGRLDLLFNNAGIGAPAWSAAPCSTSASRRIATGACRLRAVRSQMPSRGLGRFRG